MTYDEVRELYDRYGYLVHRRCLALLGNATDANDALQETFLRVMKYGPAQVDSTLAWLYGIATRVCFDQLDRRRRAEPWPARALARLGEVLGRHTAADPELALAIGAELSRLTAPVREMVILRHLEGAHPRGDRRAHGDTRASGSARSCGRPTVCCKAALDPAT